MLKGFVSQILDSIAVLNNKTQCCKCHIKKEIVSHHKSIQSQSTADCIIMSNKFKRLWQRNFQKTYFSQLFSAYLVEKYSKGFASAILIYKLELEPAFKRNMQKRAILKERMT